MGRPGGFPLFLGRRSGPAPEISLKDPNPLHRRMDRTLRSAAARARNKLLTLLTVRAETMLARVLVDQPEWEDTMRVEPVELATGGLN
jgi:hypothetical protein